MDSIIAQILAHLASKSQKLIDALQNISWSVPQKSAHIPTDISLESFYGKTKACAKGTKWTQEWVALFHRWMGFHLG